MKRLYILRHAKAASPAGVTDFERPLDIEGQSDAAALGVYMQQKLYIPAHVLCSPALRTRQTFEGVYRGIGTDINDTEDAAAYIEPLYEATSDHILESIQDCDDRFSSVMVVGHNPAVHELVMRLTSEDSALSLMKRLMHSYHPGTLSVLDCPSQCWNDIQLGENLLVDFLEPLDYNAPSRPTRWM